MTSEAFQREMDRVTDLVDKITRPDRKIAYRGYWISYEPKPIPASCGVDWDFWHDDYDPTPNHADDGPSDHRCGNAPSLEECKAAIDEQIAEQEDKSATD